MLQLVARNETFQTVRLPRCAVLLRARNGCLWFSHRFRNHLHRWNVFVWGQIYRHKFKSTFTISIWALQWRNKRKNKASTRNPPLDHIANNDKNRVGNLSLTQRIRWMNGVYKQYTWALYVKLGDGAAITMHWRRSKLPMAEFTLNIKASYWTNWTKVDTMWLKHEIYQMNLQSTMLKSDTWS